MYKYKLIKLPNSLTKKKGAVEKSWYAVAVGGQSLKVKQMAREATKNTTLAPMEMELALELLSNFAVTELLHGHIVRLGELGSLRITFQSEGAEEVEAYDANTMIHKPRIVFRPSEEFRKRVLGKLHYQNAGVLDNGVSYGSIADYRKAKAMKQAAANSSKGGGE